MTVTRNNKGMQAGERLRQMSQTNERLKEVLRLSRRVGMGATNASLLARQAGTASQGFRVAAAELGSFSRRMDQVMAVLEGVIFEAVNDAANLQKQMRRQKLLQAATDGSNRARVQAWAESSGQVVAHNEKTVETGRMRLLAHLERAALQGNMGRVTARLARLEAVHGGSLAKSMGDAVAAIEETVAQIIEIIWDLTRTFEEASA